MPKKKKVEAKADELLEKASGTRWDRGRLEGDRGTGRPRRQGQRRRRPPHQLLDPPGRQRRAADRAEADPRRLKLLEATAIYRAKGKNPFNEQLSGAGVLLLSKEALQQRVLANQGLDIYQCGREDIERARSIAASSRCSSTCG